MVERANLIEFQSLCKEDSKYTYTVMIILNRPIFVEQYTKLRNFCNYVICADGAANRLYELKEREQYQIIYPGRSSFPTLLLGTLIQSFLM